MKIIKIVKKIINSKYMDYIIKGIYAGLLIAIGGTVYLSLENKIAGSFFFSIGLLTICMYGMNLFTGKVGYILVNKKNYLVEVLLSLLGNLIGTVGYSLLFRCTKYSVITEKALMLTKLKLADTPLSIFILSMFCGMLMYIAVNNYKKVSGEIGKYLMILMCVMVFILCGFEHSIANMFYFSVSGMFTFKMITYLLIMVLGNTCGSLIIAMFFNRFYKN